VRTIGNDNLVTQYCYDEVNRLVRSIYNPAGTGDPCDPLSYSPSTNPDEDVIRETVYDENGNAIATIDPLGMVTRSYYDELNRPYLVIQNVDPMYIYLETPPACKSA
jgi:hypothetical protein